MDRKKRYWEIDTVRGIAVILMIISNYAFALSFLNIYTVGGGQLFWLFFPRLIAGIFIFLVGVSLTISYSRVKHKTKRELYKKYFFRGLKIFGYGLIITLVTWLYLKEGFVVFGILHFIGISIILSYLFLPHRLFNFLLGIALILTGFFLYSLRFNFPWLLWLGFIPINFSSIDYFPILPWFGITLIGIAFGNLFYPNGIRRFRIFDRSKSLFIKPFSFLGRNSLLIYLIHQLVLIAVLYILGFV